MAVISNYAAENDVVLDTADNRFAPLPVREGRGRMNRETRSPDRFPFVPHI